MSQILCQDFLDQMESELQANKHKGEWKDWEPSHEEWMWEFTWHLSKLQNALQQGNKEEIREFTADLANLAEKAYNQFS